MDEPTSTPVGVLIIDDHTMFAESLARLLTDEPEVSVVGVASTGAAGLDLAIRLRPTVVLLDYRLPDSDGVTLAAAIKEQAPEVMVVMLTGSADDEVLVGAIRAGCSGFLTKDRAAAEVADAVRRSAIGEALITPSELARLLPQLGRSRQAVGADLTAREIEVLNHLARGQMNKVIATDLHLSLNTVRNYVQSVLQKLGAHSKLEAVATAVRAGIIDYP